MIIPLVLVITVMFTLGWGWHMLDTIDEYRCLRVDPKRTKAQMGDSFRAMIAAICLVSLCLAYPIRCAALALGLGDILTVQFVFFAIVGFNVPCFIFAIVSRKLD